MIKAVTKMKKILSIRMLKIIIHAFKYSVSFIIYLLIMSHKRKDEIWLIAERRNEARDNAFHLFRYIRENYPEIMIFYAISRGAEDRNKIEHLGNIIDFGSIRHYVYYFRAKKYISTHINGYMPHEKVCSIAERIIKVKGKRVFLQHGIIKDFLIGLTKDRIKLDLFVCGAFPEYEYVRDNFGFVDNIVKYLGLCRFDSLHDHKMVTKKQILLMPTFRMNYCIDKDVNVNLSKESVFLKSSYYKAYQSLINNRKLLSSLKSNNIELVFYPHYEIQKYLHLFHSESQQVIIAKNNKYDVQALLKESVLLITDYSSVYFDFGYMKKPIIYYQFDYEEFRRVHYSEGYFSYKNHGFGPVYDTEDDLVNQIEIEMDNNFTMNVRYLERIEKFFPLYDTNNCMRNFEAILQLKE